MTTLNSIAVAFLFLMAVQPSLAADVHISPKAQLGFDANLHDSAIREFVDASGVTPNAAFVWSMGLSGTHRVSRPMDGAEFTASVRGAMGQHLRKASLDAQRQLLAFFREHSREEVMRSAELQRDARSLLTYSKQVEGALAAVISGQPIVYGLEISGEEDSVRRAENDEIVSVFFDLRGNTVTKNRWNRMSLKPLAFNAEYKDPEITALSPESLYERVSAVSELPVSADVTQASKSGEQQ